MRSGGLLLHAVLNKIEGDETNSHYWYRRTSYPFEAYAEPRAKLAAIKAALGIGRFYSRTIRSGGSWT